MLTRRPPAGDPSFFKDQKADAHEHAFKLLDPGDLVSPVSKILREEPAFPEDLMLLPRKAAGDTAY